MIRICFFIFLLLRCGDKNLATKTSIKGLNGIIDLPFTYKVPLKIKLNIGKIIIKRQVIDKYFVSLCPRIVKWSKVKKEIKVNPMLYGLYNKEVVIEGVNSSFKEGKFEDDVRPFNKQ